MFLVIILLSCSSPVFAENTADVAVPDGLSVSSSGTVQDAEDGSTKITLTIPKELVGYQLILKDAEGNQVDKTKIDAEGAATIKTDGQSSYSLSLNTDKPLSLSDTQGSGIDLIDLIVYIAIAVVITVIVMFILMQIRMKKLVAPLREKLFDERLD